MSKKLSTGFYSNNLNQWVEDEHVYALMKLHSRWIDRMNPRKVFAMSTLMRDMFNMNGTTELLMRRDWKFFGKKSKPIEDEFGSLLES